MTDHEKDVAGLREYNKLDRYRELLVGKKVLSVHFTSDTDEGLVLIFDDGHVLYFGFSGESGTIAVSEK